jgi:hypothetical protein
MRKSTLVALTAALAAILLVVAAAEANPGVRIVSQGFGFKGTDSVRIDEDVIFQMYLINDENLNFMVQHGFRIYSPDGAVWSGPVRWDTLAGQVPGSNFDVAFFTNVRHGVSEDTACMLGAFFKGAGLPPYFSGPTWAIHIGSFTEADIGRHICIDSAWYPPGGRWFWCGLNGINPRYPDWSGPYCFTITRCCNGVAGDMRGNGSAGYVPDISDLTAMIDYLFGDLPMSTCPGEVDLDGSGSVDIEDLQVMGQYIFDSGSMPNCP